MTPRLSPKLSFVCLLMAAACGSDTDLQSGIQAGSGAGASGTPGAAGSVAPAAGSGTTAGTNSVPSGAAGSGGSAAGRSGAGGAGGMAGTMADDSDAGVEQAGSGGAGAPAAGTGAAAGSGGQGGAAGAAGSPARKPKCKTKPTQVVVLGDSYINWVTHTFPADLEREAGEEWRMYAVGGCSLGSGGLCLIPPQLDQAIAEDDDIIAGVMTGGGNDILIADELMFPGSTACKDRTDSATVKVCQDVVATAISAGEKLMQKAADAGVRDVIYMFYPHIPGGGFGGQNPNYMLDYSLPKAKALCDGAEQRTQGKLRCHFIDLVPIFEGHADWFADDGIHENSLGSAAMAKEVIKVAKEKCVAQPASSGCCEP